MVTVVGDGGVGEGSEIIKSKEHPKKREQQARRQIIIIVIKKQTNYNPSMYTPSKQRPEVQ